MSACVMEEGREDGGGRAEDAPDRARREVLLSARGRRACSEQGPHPTLQIQHSTAHLWGQGGGRRGWSRKRTSAPQMSNPHGSMPRVALVLRSRRSWPVAPQSYRRSRHVQEKQLRSEEDEQMVQDKYKKRMPRENRTGSKSIDRASTSRKGRKERINPARVDPALSYELFGTDSEDDQNSIETVAPEPVISSPRPLGQQSPLPGIEEEDDSDWPLEDATDATLTPSYKSTRSSTDTYTSSRSSGKKRFGSPSAVKICISAAARKSGKVRQRGSGVGSVSPSGPPAPGEEPPRMQAEQGSIGELQKYHGRYLKSRRHTLANVRFFFTSPKKKTIMSQEKNTTLVAGQQLVKKTMDELIQQKQTQEKVSIQARQEFKESFQASYEEEFEEEIHIDAYGNKTTKRVESSSESSEHSKSADVQVKATGLNDEQVQALTDCANQAGQLALDSKSAN